MENQTAAIADLDVVALLEDIVEDGLIRGEVGTVVDISPHNGMCFVTFSDDMGVSYAGAFARPDQLMRLTFRRHEGRLNCLRAAIEYQALIPNAGLLLEEALHVAPVLPADGEQRATDVAEGADLGRLH